MSGAFLLVCMALLGAAETAPEPDARHLAVDGARLPLEALARTVGRSRVVLVALRGEGGAKLAGQVKRALKRSLIARGVEVWVLPTQDPRAFDPVDTARRINALHVLEATVRKQSGGARVIELVLRDPAGHIEQTALLEDVFRPAPVPAVHPELSPRKLEENDAYFAFRRYALHFKLYEKRNEERLLGHRLVVLDADHRLMPLPPMCRVARSMDEDRRTLCHLEGNALVEWGPGEPPANAIALVRLMHAYNTRLAARLHVDPGMFPRAYFPLRPPDDDED